MAGLRPQTGSTTFRCIELEGSVVNYAGWLPPPTVLYCAVHCVAVVGDDEYASNTLWPGDDDKKLPAAYGGQVMGQALMAACHTVTDPELLLHSAHCYFMSPVKTGSPVTYRVARTKDGRVFSTRAIQALQGGKVLSYCLAAFKRPEPDPPALSHSPAGVPPGLLPPDDPRLDSESIDKLLFNHKPHNISAPFDRYDYFSGNKQERLLAGEPVQPRYMCSYWWV